MPVQKAVFYPGDIPSKPGVYLYRDAFGTVIYVGKASNLRRRMSQYFQPSRRAAADPKLRSLINSIDSWECLTVRSEDEALILESRLIKKYAPKYNVLLRDDKRMYLVKIDLSESFPRPRLTRLRKDDSCLYYGPFPHGAVLKQTLDFLIRHFSLRPCRTREPEKADFQHCMSGMVRDCPRPCAGKVSADEYRANVERLLDVMNGNVADVAAEVGARMTGAAAGRDFEKAAMFRDMIKNIEYLCASRTRSFENAVIPSVCDGPAALADLADALHLPVPPANMAAFDNSTISGTLSVASMVVFKDGRPFKNGYRRFRIKTVEGVNDFAMMREVVTRHFSRLLAEKRPMPDLMVVDGGKGQLSYAVDALVALKCPPFPVIGLAKRNEEVFLPGRSEPLIIERDRPALKLLQAIRDESHRFAVTYNRLLRLRQIQDSLLDEMPNIGETRKSALLKTFGSVFRLRNASPDEIARRVPGIGPEMAAMIAKFLADHPPDGNIDPL